MAGILGAALLVKMVVRARRCRGGGCGGHGWHRHAHGRRGRFGGPYGGEDFSFEHPFDRSYDRPFDRPFEDDGDGAPVMLRGVFEGLRTTPGQERAIVEALRELKGTMKKAAEQGRKAASAVGDAMKSDELSTDAMGSAYAHLDEAAEALRSASFETLTKIHDALDAKQRRILADFLKRPRGLEDLADGA